MKNQIFDTMLKMSSDKDPMLINGMTVGFMAGLALALQDPLFASTAQLQLIQEWRSSLDQGQSGEYGPGEMAKILLNVMKGPNN